MTIVCHWEKKSEIKCLLRLHVNILMWRYKCKKKKALRVDYFTLLSQVSGGMIILTVKENEQCILYQNCAGWLVCTFSLHPSQQRSLKWMCALHCAYERLWTSPTEPPHKDTTCSWGCEPPGQSSRGFWWTCALSHPEVFSLAEPQNKIVCWILGCGFMRHHNIY